MSSLMIPARMMPPKTSFAISTMNLPNSYIKVCCSLCLTLSSLLDNFLLAIFSIVFFIPPAKVSIIPETAKGLGKKLYPPAPWPVDRDAVLSHFKCLYSQRSDSEIRPSGGCQSDCLSRTIRHAPDVSHQTSSMLLQSELRLL
mgnify:CR=1 FL=1